MGTGGRRDPFVALLIRALFIRRGGDFPPAPSRRRAAIAFCALFLAGCSAPASPPVEVTPVVAAARVAPFTTTQADRGQRLFTEVCGVCHGPSEFRGPLFNLTWMADPVADFFQFISESMPQDRPGSLSPDEYASVVAYLLRLNGLRAGDVELPPDPVALERFLWRE
jgi:mono/diheme cytochrome c family protein